jgi:hypothetical protein
LNFSEALLAKSSAVSSMHFLLDAAYICLAVEQKDKNLTCQFLSTLTIGS